LPQQSQQDLTLEDLDNLDEQIKKNKRGKSHSPDRETGSKRQWDATYDKGKGTNTEAANTADEIFQKFGIAFSFGNDEEESKNLDNKTEELELLSGQYENTNFVADEDDNDFHDHLSGFESSLKDDTLSDSYACSDASSQWTSTASSTSSKKKKNSKTNSSQKTEAELCLMDDPLDYSSGYAGQVSPVYIEELGESTTDPNPRDSFSSSRFNYSDIDIQSDSPSVLGYDASSPDDSSARNSVICVQPISGSPPPQAEEQQWQFNGFDLETNSVSCVFNC
jgi:hypothetical protein